MKKILLINDGSTAVNRAAKLALQIARDIHAEILVVLTYHVNKALASKVTAGGHKAILTQPENETEPLYQQLQQWNNEMGGFRPAISLNRYIEADANALAELAMNTECEIIKSQVATWQLPGHSVKQLNTITFGNWHESFGTYMSKRQTGI